MESESRSTLRAFAEGAAAPVTSSGAAVPGGTIQTLAQAANDLIQAIQASAPIEPVSANAVP